MEKLSGVIFYVGGFFAISGLMYGAIAIFGVVCSRILF